MINYPFNARHLTTLLLAALLTTLSACAPLSLDSDSAETPEQALEAAQAESDRGEAQKYLLGMADRFRQDNNPEGARMLLRSDLMAEPSDESREQYFLLSMATANDLEDRDWAEALAEQLPLDLFQRYDQDLQREALKQQLAVYDLAAEPLNKALTLMAAGSVLDQDDPQRTNDRIWQALKQTPERQLQQAGNRSIGFDSQGWLELAMALREPGMTLDAQGRVIREWQANWAGHPAATDLPGELSLISMLSSERPQKIALALPMSGNLASAGKAIRDGFMAAFYTDGSDSAGDLEITVTDTSERDFADIYRELVKEGADLIVGPLDKDALGQAADLDERPVPVLGLNYLRDQRDAPSGLYQFGLSAEDEARQIADRLQADQLNQVLVMIPAGEWGDRVESALMERLQQNGGTALDVERFFNSDNLRSVVADVLGIDVSRQRAIDVEQTIGQNLEFEPRRRQDVDAIVMVAQPTTARQLKPLFAFYFAGDLPVYSPSLVYEGSPDPSRDRDLNQVRFTDIPWVLEEDDDLRDRVQEVFSGLDGQLGRLAALGADAYELGTRLPLMEQVPETRVDGLTGELAMENGRRIRRIQQWAYFRSGVPEELPPAVVVHDGFGESAPETRGSDGQRDLQE